MFAIDNSKIPVAKMCPILCYSLYKHHIKCITYFTAQKGTIPITKTNSV